MGSSEIRKGAEGDLYKDYRSEPRKVWQHFSFFIVCLIIFSNILHPSTSVFTPQTL